MSGATISTEKLTPAAGSGSNNCCVVGKDEPIDLTYYTALHANVSNITASGYGWLVLVKAKTFSNSTIEATIRIVHSGNLQNSGDISLDVSSMTGEYYVAFLTSSGCKYDVNRVHLSC